MPPTLPTIVVAGSAIMDLVIHAPRQPRVGETVIGSDFGMYLGGKGANQAAAAARLGGRVTFVGCVGADPFGEQFRRSFAAEGIDARFVVTDARLGTGVGMPEIYPDGQNSIVIAPQANMALTPAHVEAAAEEIRAAAVLLFQLEIPLDAVQRAVEIAHAAGVCVIGNPAPARPLPDELLARVTWLVPNEAEAEQLSGVRVVDDASAERAALALLARGPRYVAITRGAAGATLVSADACRHVPAFPVDPVDTTGAGDAFCGALAVALARGTDPVDAVRFANAAGALATTVVGAQPSMPRAAQIAALMLPGG